MKNINKKLYFALLFLLVFISPLFPTKKGSKSPIDYVNPNIGNISHLLVPTYPTIHLPNSMLRVYPERESYTGNVLEGLPLMIPSHRAKSAFALSPFQGDEKNIKSIIHFGYDNEIIMPYYYRVDLDDYGIRIQYAPSHQSAIYEINFDKTQAAYLILRTRDGELEINENIISGYQNIGNKAKVYLYLETNIKPVRAGAHSKEGFEKNTIKVFGKDAYLAMQFPAGTPKVGVRYGVSFISVEQARKNLRREINDYNLVKIAKNGRNIWNRELSKIVVKGGSNNDKVVFYTSLYRIAERMICISEDGKYYSGYDNQVHDDKGMPFYVDDWIWDTYRAVHPLRLIINTQKESDMINSFIRMAYQMQNHWMPTFPEVYGDTHRMNGNHGVATIIDAYNKGLRTFDLEKAYQACKSAITEKTLAPWSGKKSGILDKFYDKNGYFPALAVGEKETILEVDSWEKRQPVAVTLGTVFDEWCLGSIAEKLGYREDSEHFLKRSLNYRKVFNEKTKFFHPKDSFGNFIQPFDYRYSSGIGARDAYDENNGWIYRWDVQHNIADLIQMNGGKEFFVYELERMYNTPLGKSRPDFHSQFGDHTGNVGQFSMGNEPSMHIPYLYNYAGQPWRTQKRVRNLLSQWFRNDLMGVPGDEDGGGLSSFVVFSQLGFYPVTPGLPMYVIGSPVFKTATIKLENGRTFEVICHNYSIENKYIQSAKLNGQIWNKSWFSHSELMNGGRLEFTMGKYPNKKWASGDKSIPPSFKY